MGTYDHDNHDHIHDNHDHIHNNHDHIHDNIHDNHDHIHDIVQAVATWLNLIMCINSLKFVNSKHGNHCSKTDAEHI